MPILIKEKPCKGTGKCLGLGCGQMQKIRKYGLGTLKKYIYLINYYYLCVVNLRSHNSGIKNIACLFDLGSETLNDSK
jgi:hypothetical protein